MTENLHNNNQSPMGHTPLNTGYGSFGVNHSQFATQKDSFQQSNMGTIGNYVQHGTNFWQASPENNRRFGENEIKQQICNNFCFHGYKILKYRCVKISLLGKVTCNCDGKIKTPDIRHKKTS